MCALILITALHTLMAGGLSNSDWKTDNLMLNALSQVIMIDYGTNLQRAAGLNAAGREGIAHTEGNDSPESLCKAHIGVPAFRCAAGRALVTACRAGSWTLLLQLAMLASGRSSVSSALHGRRSLDRRRSTASIAQHGIQLVH